MCSQQLKIFGGWVLIMAGFAGALAGVFLLAVPSGVPPGVFNYPLSAGAFIVVQSVFAVQHLLTGLGLWLFWRTGFAGTSRLAAVAGWSTAAIMAALGCWEIVVIAGIGAPYPSDSLSWIDSGYGALSLLSGVSLVMLGISAMRAHVLPRGWRLLPLVIGVWVFVPMIPALTAGFVAGRIAIGIWLLLFAGLGWRMLRETTFAAQPRRTPVISRGAGS